MKGRKDGWRESKGRKIETKKEGRQARRKMRRKNIALLFQLGRG